ncbi:MAG: protein kinase [Planctomycetota bacterium]|nr:protein kinase [Planctomycetota bacterium]
MRREGAKPAAGQLDPDRTSSLSPHAASPGPVSPTVGLLARPQEPAGPNQGFPNIPNYRILRKLSEGGMGVVYHAIKLADVPWFQREVAVKVIRAGQFTPEALDRFKLECRILQQVDAHRGIATIFDAGEYTHGPGDVRPYFSMQYIPGSRNLRTYATQADLSLSDRLELLAQVCDAVAAAHEKGVIHLDLKPSNILVDPYGCPVVVDFGVARAAGFVSETDPDVVVGTAQYMAPEQAAGSAGSLTQRCDVYALGLVCYEILTGRLPYKVEARARADLADSIRRARVALPRTHQVDIPPLAEAAVMHALEKQPEQRASSASELARRLREARESLRDQHTIERVRAENTLLRARRWLSARLGTALAAAAILALIVSEAVVLPLVYLTPLHKLTVHALTRLPAPRFVGELEEQVLIAITDLSDMEALARREAIAGVSHDAAWTYRPLHAALIRRLIEARPAAIAFDFTFAGERPGDQALAAAIADARQADIPVLAVEPAWSYAGTEGSPTSPALIRAGLARAPATATFDFTNTAAVELAVRHPEQKVQPSLALLTYALSLTPAAPIFELDAEAVDLLVGSSAASGLSRRPVGYVDLVERADSQAGIQVGAQIAVLDVILPPEPVFTRRTSDYEGVMNMPAGQLAQLVQGKTVFIANLKQDVDRHQLGGGRTVPGVYAPMAALDNLRRGVALRSYLPVLHLSLVVLAAAVGVALGALSWRPGSFVRRACASWIFTTACIVTISIVLFTWRFIVVDPVVLSGVVLVSMTLALIVRNLADIGVPGLRESLSTERA